MEEDSLVIGIDIGTGGVRVLAATLMGEVVAIANASIEVSGSKLALAATCPTKFQVRLR